MKKVDNQFPSWQRQREEIIKYLERKISQVPQVMLILGSSLGGIGENIENQIVIPYEQIPHLPKAEAVTHKGNLIFGQLCGKDIAIMQGRLHVYEGHEVRKTTLLVNALGKMGCQVLITTNLVGGINYKVGDIMLVTDQNYSQGSSPLIAIEDKFTKKQFVNMIGAYTPRLVELAEKEAQKLGVKVVKGVLGYLTGPSFETRVELSSLKKDGVDAIGWSLCPEVIVARYHGMEILGISGISDNPDSGTVNSVNLEKLFEEGKKMAGKIEKIIKAVLEKI